MSLCDYSSLEQTIKETPEPKILPKDTEAKLRIVRITEGVSQKDDQEIGYFLVTFDVPSEITCPEFTHFFWDLSDKDKLTPKQQNRAFLSFREFAEAFDIDYSVPFSWVDDLPGKEGWALLGIQVDKTGEYPDKNVVRKFITMF